MPGFIRNKVEYCFCDIILKKEYPMKKLSDSQLKIMVYVVSALGIIGGFLLWRFIPYIFRNTSFFHVGNGEFGNKIGALIILPLQLIAFIPKDNSIEEVHTDDSEERKKLEAINARRILELQVLRAIGLALTIWVVMGLGALVL